MEPTYHYVHTLNMVYNGRREMSLVSLCLPLRIHKKSSHCRYFFPAISVLKITLHGQAQIESMAAVSHHEKVYTLQLKNLQKVYTLLNCRYKPAVINHTEWNVTIVKDVTASLAQI